MAELMELTLNTTYFNQKCVNRFNYVASGTPAAVTYSFALATAMGWLSLTTTLPTATIGADLQGILHPQVTFNSIISRAVYIDDDFYDNPFISGTVGGNSGGGDGMSPLDAYGLFSSRVKQSIARGYKRFPGIGEVGVSSGGVLTSGTLGALETLCAKMSDTLTYDDEGNSLSFIPAIVQKEKYTVVASGKDAYRYYASQAVQLEHTAQGIGWSPYPNVRSQVSRQYGRGQ